ncbi:MAG TPA: hypothetical protein VMS08_03000 [Candidatus Saccharimonadia bacterium]|nr:hypothetical protein [Candidatus Saccharimonadia bacterium]
METPWQESLDINTLTIVFGKTFRWSETFSTEWAIAPQSAKEGD